MGNDGDFHIIGIQLDSGVLGKICRDWAGEHTLDAGNRLRAAPPSSSLTPVGLKNLILSLLVHDTSLLVSFRMRWG